MEIHEITRQEFDNLVKQPFSAFDNSAFCELNRSKVDMLKYLVFNDGKNRFYLIAGIKNNIVKFPFSASFAMLANISLHNKIICYHEAVKALNAWVAECGYKKIVFSLPPHFYNPTTITMLYNALFVSGFKIENIEVNYEYYLKNFSDTYEMDIDPKARQKLRASLKNNLTFEKTNDIETVYEVIRQNREYRGFPLWMSLDDVKATQPLINMDLFLARDSEGKPVASALIYHMTDKILRVIYWGNTAESEELRPMNFLSYHVFKYYSDKPYEVIDIGHSTDDSIPNFGLCDFKQAIGCDCSPKFVMTKEF